MKKFFQDILFEHGEFSIKRTLALAVFLVMIFLVLHRALTKDFTPEGFRHIVDSFLLFIAAAIGLAMVNKMKQFRNSTNKSEEDEPN